MRLPWKVLNPVLAGLAVLAVGVAGWATYRSAGGGGADPAAVVTARQDALLAARSLAVTLQTVDPAHPDQSVQAWQAAATGPLLRKLRADGAAYLADLRKVPSISQAVVVDAALTKLDAVAGTATAVAAIDVRQAPIVRGTPGPGQNRQLRIKLTLSRTDQGWKVSSSGLVTA